MLLKKCTLLSAKDGCWHDLSARISDSISINLSIDFKVIRRANLFCCLNNLIHTLKEFRCDLLLIVWEYCLWQSINLKQMVSSALIIFTKRRHLSGTTCTKVVSQSAIKMIFGNSFGFLDSGTGPLIKTSFHSNAGNDFRRLIHLRNETGFSPINATMDSSGEISSD